MNVMPAVTDARASAGPRRISRILLATDLSPASDGAADEAIQLAHDLRAELLLVSVIDAMRGASFDRQVERMDQRRAARELAAQALVIRGRRAGVETSFLVWEGDPGPAIVEAADAEHVDLVVVGTRGRNRIERAVLGSVSDHVIRNASCPVLIVRS